MKRVALLFCLISAVCFAETSQEKAAEFIKWKFEKSADLSAAERMSCGQSFFDIDRISLAIRKEGRLRKLSSPISKIGADNFIREMLAQPMMKSTVEFIDVKVAERSESTSVLFWFKAFPANGGLPAETKAQFRKIYSVVPRAGDVIGKQHPSIPSYALSSASSLISYLEEKAAGNPPTHEYEFVFDNKTGLITDWKILFEEGASRKSTFLNLVDNIQRIKSSGY